MGGFSFGAGRADDCPARTSTSNLAGSYPSRPAGTRELCRPILLLKLHSTDSWQRTSGRWFPPGAIQKLVRSLNGWPPVTSGSPISRIKQPSDSNSEIRRSSFTEHPTAPRLTTKAPHLEDTAGAAYKQRPRRIRQLPPLSQRKVNFRAWLDARLGEWPENVVAKTWTRGSCLGYQIQLRR